MIFLKRFKAVGFKSFANPIDLSFKDSMVGIVGPNGTGKSNIVDAIKWVLGEQSKKILRGKTSGDIIFHGSKDKDGSEYALVSLTFDNSNKLIHSDLNEITVTRKLTRASGENEYFINNEVCRLKDIQELFIDTGLAKGSLGIISQGTVQWFVEAKPDERRKIFEDAAGIGLYSKKKADSLNDLEKATNNLNRVSDYVAILKRDITKLSKQVEKAQIYSEKKRQLMELELIVLVKDVTYYSNKLAELKNVINHNKETIFVNESDIETYTKQISVVREKANYSDKVVEDLTNDLTNLIEEINKLEIKKNSIENQLKDDLSSGSIEKKTVALKQLITNLEFDLENAKNSKAKLADEVEGYTQITNDLVVKHENLISKISTIANNINKCQYRIRYIEDKIENEYVNDSGIKAILDNKNALSGIVGTVKTFINVNKQYETAISIALGKAANFIITDNEDSAKYAIQFLKNNKAGKATFLPLTLIKPRSLKEEHAIIVKQLEGYINTADKLITYDDKYANIFSMLLGRTIVANDLNSAVSLSKYTNSSYPVVSLDGQIISVGGAITGGSTRTSAISTFNLDEAKKEAEIELQALSKEYTQAKIDEANTASALADNSNRVNEKKILFNSYDQSITTIENNLFRYRTDYEQLTNSKETTTIEVTVDDINKQMASLTTKKEKVVQELNLAKVTKNTNRQIYDDYQAKLDETRVLVDKAKAEQARAEIESEKAKAIIENAKNKISFDYRMTIENALNQYQNKELPMSDAQARETIYQLRVDLDKIGAINQEALKELEDKQNEYNGLAGKHQELIDAKAKIEKSIAELDAQAKANFKETIDKVNQILPNVFGYLFGGGMASIQYTNPSDILNSGIEVVAVPPGKKITTLNLLSGGEKSLVALSVLFAILKVHSFPLVVLDEAESSLDPANVERFGNIIRKTSNSTQFVVITHRPGTMERCESLFGTTMQIKGITNMYKVTLANAKSEFGSDE